MLIIGLSIRLTSKGSAIFKQERIGMGGIPFVCLKFRTMYLYAPCDLPSSQFSDSEKYITPLGRFLRRSSLDELPQLWNVLLGHMSLVGPRPLIASEGDIHKLRQRCGVYNIRPGITGLAQISGRNMLDNAKKARLDVIYAKNMTLYNDLRIILKTFSRIILGESPSNTANKNNY